MIVLQASHTIYQWVNSHPDLLKIIEEIGFKDIVKPGMLQTVGRVMTFPMGCSLRKIDYHWAVNELAKYGYKVEEEHK